MNLFKSKNNLLLFLTIFLAIILRFSWLDRIPPALYTDEVDQGYNAYSLLKTGRDEHGAIFPISLRSFGDWKPPVQTWIMMPFVATLGLNEWSVRLPGAIMGIFSVYFVYLLVKQLELEERYPKLPYLAAFFVAISPWHIQQSRMAMLVMVSLFFLQAGIYFFIRKSQKNSDFILSAFSFCLSVYAYYGMRVIIPLMVLYLIYSSRKRIRVFSQKSVYFFLTIIIILLPLGLSFIKKNDVVLGRAKTVSIFYDKGVKLLQWRMFAEDGIGFNTYISRFFHNNVYMFGRSILERYLSHFNLSYLLFTGDQSSPFQIPGMGIIYFADVIFIIFGMIIIFREKLSGRNLLGIWFFVSFVPAAFTFMTPANNRTFNAIIPLMIFSALGFFYMYKTGKLLRIVSLILSVFYLFNFGYFLNQYFKIMPIFSAPNFSYEWSETGKYLANEENKYHNITILDDNSMVYAYVLFYSKYDPAKYQKEAVRTYVADEYGFEHVTGFGKYNLLGTLKFDMLKDNLISDTLYVIPANQASKDIEYVHTVKEPDGKEAIKFYYKK